MAPEELDAIDRGIIHALQEDARNITSDEIGDRVGAAGSTVRKRIKALEKAGVIKRYTALIDYEQSGYPIRMLLFCTAPIAERGDLVEDILGIPGVVSVQELITGEQNLLVTAIGETDSDITPIAQQLNDLGVTVSDEVLVRQRVIEPFDDFAPANDQR